MLAARTGFFVWYAIFVWLPPNLIECQRVCLLVRGPAIHESISAIHFRFVAEPFPVSPFTRRGLSARAPGYWA